MSERIDHAAEAARLLEIQVSGDIEANVILQVIANTVGAQVHATLALVEQQRIANLLALLKPEDPRSYDCWAQISQGLGLEQ